MASSPSAPSGQDFEAPDEQAAMSVRGAAAWAIAGQYLTFAIQFATSVIISRFFLTPAEVGLFSIGLAAAMLVAVLQDFGLSRYLSGLPRLESADVQRSSTVSLFLSFGVAAIIAALALPLATLYNQPELLAVILLIAASYLFMPLSIVPMALMARSMQFRGHFWVNVSGAVAQSIVAIGLASLGYSTLCLAWATIATSIGRGIAAQLFRPALPWPLRLDGLGNILSFGSRTSSLYLTGALGTRAPDLIVGKLLTLTAVGLYSRAVALSDQFRTLISGAIGSVFYPAFARIRDRGEEPAAAYLRVCAGYSAIVWPGMAGLAVASEPLVRLLYGEAWVRTAPLLAMIALTEIILISLPLVSELPILYGKLNRLIMFNLLDTIVSITLLAFGCLWGVEGAAATRLVYGLFWWLLYFGFMKNIIRFGLADLGRVYAKSGLATLIAIVPLGIIYFFVAAPEMVGFGLLLIGTASGIICWLLTLMVTRHPALDDLLSVAESLPVVGRYMSNLSRWSNRSPSQS